MSLPKSPFRNNVEQRVQPKKSKEEQALDNEKFYDNDGLNLDDLTLDDTRLSDDSLTEDDDNLSLGENSNELNDLDDTAYLNNDSESGEEDYLIVLDEDDNELSSSEQGAEPQESLLVEENDENQFGVEDEEEYSLADDEDSDSSEDKVEENLLDSDQANTYEDDEENPVEDKLSEESEENGTEDDGDWGEIDLLNKAPRDSTSNDAVGSPESRSNGLSGVAPAIPPRPSRDGLRGVPTRPIRSVPRTTASERILDSLDRTKSIDAIAKSHPELGMVKQAPLTQQRLVPLVEGQPKQQKKVINTHRSGSITSDWVMTSDYAVFAHLEEKIRTMVGEIQQTLSDNGKSEWIGEARRERNTEKFVDAADYIDRMITRSLSSNAGMSIDPQDTNYFIASVLNEILGFGPIEPLWNDPTVSEIMINGPGEVRIERKGMKEVVPGIKFRDQEHAMQTANSFLTFTGRSVNTRTPFADASLPDGSRINVVHPVIAPDGPFITIRRFPDTVFSLEKLVQVGSMDEDMAVILGNLVNIGVSIVVAGSTGTGKALDVDTPIPTPAGMIRLGDLNVGDTVYGADGLPTTIVGVFDQKGGRTCYIVRFSDGNSVIADAEHNWLVNGEVMTTQQIVDTPEVTEWKVPLTQAVQYSKQDLPVDPYLLGYWFGCCNPNGLISAENPDVESVLQERNINYRLSFKRTGTMIEVDGFSDMLSALGLSDGLATTKPLFIPEAYLIASEEQRRALLAGILDNDAILHKNDGTIELIVSNNEGLARQILRLTGSLGIVAQFKEMQYGDDHLITLIISTEQDVFHRKGLAELHRQVRVSVQNFKTIISVEPTDSVSVRCITVNNHDHLYLFGEHHTVTHNTSMLNALSGCIDDTERIITVEDTLELQLHPKKNRLPMQSRPPGPNGNDGISIRDVVRNTLRMAPDRIVVGEVRDSSAYDMLQAMSTGHDGSLTTTHASNPRGTLERLQSLASEAESLDPERAMTLIAGAVDIIINLDRFHEDGSRRVVAVSEVPSVLEDNGDRRVLLPRLLWEWVRDGETEVLDGYEKIKDENGDEQEIPRMRKVLVGHYEKVNDLSDSFNAKYAMSARTMKSKDELYELSAVEAPGE